MAQGFSLCGICDASNFENEALHLQEWLNNGYAGDMQYMHNHLNLRLHPSQLVENTQSIVVVALNYFPKQLQRNDSYTVAKYAYGEDYHHVMKNKLHQLLHELKKENPKLEGRPFVDSAPVLERQLAQRAGLGWIGKNTLLITPQYGSFVFLGELFLNMPLEYDKPFTQNRCGTCTKCIQQCPTQALVSNEVMDARRCISYLTIEKRTPWCAVEKKHVENHLYGCDICQDVCPWNKKAQATTEPLFHPQTPLLTNSPNDWNTLSEEQYTQLFQASAIQRIKYSGLQRNALHCHLNGIH